MTRRWLAAAVIVGVAFVQVGCGPKKADDGGRPAAAADAPAAAEADSVATAEKPQEVPKITLKIGYPPGRYEMVQEMDMKMTIDMIMEGQNPPPKQHVNQKMTFWSTMDVAQPNAAGNTTMTMRFTRMKQEMDGGPIRMSLDTDDRESVKNNPMGKMLTGLCATTLTILLDAEGKAIEVKGVDEMWDRMAETSPGAAAAMIVRFKQQMGDKAMARIYTQSMARSPKEPVGIGSIWRPEMIVPMPMMGQMVFRSECELVKLEPGDRGRIATIKVSGSGTAEKGDTQAFEGMPAKVDAMDINMDGHVLVNVKTGLPMDESMDLSGTFTMTMGAGQTGMKMEMGLKGTTRTTVTVVK